MAKYSPSVQTEALLKALSTAIRQRMTVKEASKRLGYKTPKQLYNRLSGHTPFPFGEALDLISRLGLDLRDILVEAGLLRPSLLDVAALLRHFAGRSEPEDPDLRRYLAEPPARAVRDGKPEGDLQAPKRFLEIEELWSNDPDALSKALKSWLETSYLGATLEPSAENLVKYCSALDLVAGHIARRGRHLDAAALIAHAIDLCPRDAFFRGYLLDHAAATLRRLGQPRLALLIAQTATADAYLSGDPELHARTLLTLAAICVILDTDEDRQKAQAAYRRILETTPQSRHGLAAAVYLAYTLVEDGRPEPALGILRRLERSSTRLPMDLQFRYFWIQGRAYAGLGEFETAAELYETALQFRPADQDPINLLLVLDGLRQVPGISSARLTTATVRISPYLSKMNRRFPMAAAIGKRVIRGIQGRVSSRELDTLFDQVRKLSER